MTTTETSRSEFARETTATRRYLERLPDDARGTQGLATAGDDALVQPWRMKIRGTVRFERRKGMVFATSP
jgi:hypothetical protein